MKLFFKTLGDGPPLIILHGLFGSSDNWLSHAKEFSNHFKVYLVDQRNHGHSPHSEEMSYDVMAEDLLELVASENLRELVLLGHSMGGKTVLRFAQQNAFLVEKMIVADMGIKAYSPHHDAIFKGLYAVDVDHCGSRKEAEEKLAMHVEEESTRQFLLKNLYWKEPGKLGWRFNLDVLFRKNPDILKALPPVTVDCPALFIRGEYSNYVPESDYDAIRAVVPSVIFQTIPGAGHWVHAEAPELFRKMVFEYLL